MTLGRAWKERLWTSLLFFAGWPVRDRWYADNRDLVKWGVLLRLADLFQAQRILQLAFYRPSEPGEFGRLTIDDKVYDLPDEVVAHFRDLRAAGRLGAKVRVTVFDPRTATGRPTYRRRWLCCRRSPRSAASSSWIRTPGLNPEGKPASITS